MGERPEHRSLDAIAVPAFVIGGDRVVYVNAAGHSLWGAEKLLGRPLAQTLEQAVSARDVDGLQLLAQALRGGPQEGRRWMSFRDRESVEQTYDVHWRPGPGEREHTFVFLTVPPETVVHQLSDALARASWGLVQLRDEREILEAAADAVASQGFRVITYLFDGDDVMHGPIRMDPEVVRDFERSWGCPIHEARMPRSQAQSLVGCVDRKRAVFVQDTHLVVDQLHTPERAAIVKRTLPRQAVNAPVFVEGEPFCVISAQRDTLLPAEAGAIELFAQRVGSAIENTRNHRRAARRLAEVERLQRELVAQERLATLGQAAAVVAHEVRNPVATIINAVTLLKRTPGVPAFSGPVLQMAEEEALRLDRIVNDLLHLGRPLEPSLESVDLHALVEKSIRSIQARRDADVRVVLTGGPVRGLVDPFLLELALENLLANALRVSPAGSTVTVRVEELPGAARLTVDDQGPGIPPDRRERIFEPFFTTYAKGTGLGLAIVRRVVDAHRGHVRAEGSPSGGARFQVELPA